MHSKVIFWLGVIFCIFRTNPVFAQEVMHHISDSGELHLSESGNVRFADIFFPDPALAKTWLTAQLALPNRISTERVGIDRYGHRLITSDLSENMLRDGVAVIYAQGRISPAWSEAERSAAQQKKGVWDTQHKLILTPQETLHYPFTFHLVEGTITRTYQRKNTVYLNFGDDWKTDFSVMIPGRANRTMSTLLPKLQPGVFVQVRGTLYPEQGMLLRITRPENIIIFPSHQ